MIGTHTPRLSGQPWRRVGAHYYVEKDVCECCYERYTHFDNERRRKALLIQRQYDAAHHRPRTARTARSSRPGTAVSRVANATGMRAMADPPLQEAGEARLTPHPPPPKGMPPLPLSAGSSRSGMSGGRRPQTARSGTSGMSGKRLYNGPL